MRDQTEWVETVEAGCNILVGANKEKISDAVLNFVRFAKTFPPLYGDGDTGERILEIIK
jgi:UDP-N-acetylglucosamine 2-epimerase